MVSAAPLASQEIRQIAMDAYVYAYPIVLMEMTRRAIINVNEPNGLGQAPINQFGHFKAFPDATFSVVVRPNADTLYSSLWFDVSTEPLVIQIPDSMGRYYLLPTMDMWTDVFSSRGTRTTGNKAQTFALVGPDWKGTLPSGVEMIRSHTPIGWMIGRTQTNGKKDYASVHRFQSAITTTPLSQWGKPFTWPSGKINLAWIPTMTPIAAVEKMDADSFFTLFAELLKTHRPHAMDQRIIESIRRIGLEAGKPFVFKKLDSDTQNTLSTIPKMAHQLIHNQYEKAGMLANGWRIINTSIGTYGTDYLQRAAIAHSALGSNLIEDTIYPKTFTDSTGQPLESGVQYRIHFSKGQLPPVHGFWSLTLYDQRQLFAPNPLDRHAIGDRDPLRFNPDGSLDLFIQTESPGMDKESNWLPAPKSGPFSLILRLYWPNAEAFDGRWHPPEIRRITTGFSSKPGPATGIVSGNGDADQFRPSSNAITGKRDFSRARSNGLFPLRSRKRASAPLPNNN